MLCIFVSTPTWDSLPNYCQFDTLIRVHRKPGYYFWKIIFVLHMLVLLTLTSFFFPGDEEGVAIRVSISSTM